MTSLAAVQGDARQNSATTVTPVFGTELASSSPLRHFAHFFHASLAQTDIQKHQTYRLRHRVYCEELQFEPQRESGLEHDQYDNRAIHCAISRLSTAQLAGTVRLITSADAGQLLPLEQYCAATLNHPTLSPAAFAREQICEISRLAVPGEIRQRKQSQSPLGHNLNKLLLQLEQRCCEAVAIALYLVAMLMCLHYGKHHVFVMVEPALARILKRIGMHFVQIGEVVDVNGKRAPYYVDARATFHTLGSEYKTLSNILAAQLFAHDTETGTPQCDIVPEQCKAAAEQIGLN